MLQNPIYNGRFVYNRVRVVRDPDSRNRVSRPNSQADRIEGSFLDLKIIKDDPWELVQLARAERAALPLVYRRRPRHFLSGLVRCGECGGNFVVINVGRWGCSRHREAGTCSNGRRLAGAELSSRVLGGLQVQLLAPEVVALLVREYHAHREAQLRRTARERDAAERRVATLDAAIARLVDAIADGTANVPEIRTAIEARREERDRVRAEITSHEAGTVIALHPQIADAYRAKIKSPAVDLARDSHDSAVAQQVRQLIQSISSTPEAEGGCQIEVHGSLAAVLALATGRKPPDGGTRRGSTVVAEEGLEPPTPGL